MKRRISCIALSIFTVGMIAVSLAGCKKEEEDHAAKFNGTWTGTATCNGGSGGVTEQEFIAVNKTKVTTTCNVGGIGCVKEQILDGTANGNTLTFPATTVLDACGQSYSVSASATITGTTLFYTISINGATSGECSFSGTK